MGPIPIAVLGAGNDTHALAGDLARMGASVILWNRTPANVAEIAAVGGVELEGEVTGFGRLFRVTSDLGEALSEADLVLVCVPAFGHKEWSPQFTAAACPLDTSFSNVGAVVHPAITLLNVARIENSQGRFDFYIDGVSEGVGRVLEAVDRERLAVAQLLGGPVRSMREGLPSATRAWGDNLYEAIQANEGYRGISAPPSMDNRYLLEDVPYSMVPMASAGRGVGPPPGAGGAAV